MIPDNKRPELIHFENAIYRFEFVSCFYVANNRAQAYQGSVRVRTPASFTFFYTDRIFWVKSIAVISLLCAESTR